MASDTHKDAELASARADPAAVKKIREFTGNNLSHEEAKRLLVECDGDVQVALNRIADGLESWNEVKEKPKKEKTVKKREDGAPSGRGRGRGGSRGGRGGHRPEGGAAPAANGGSPHPERSGRGGRGRGSERGGATQRPVSASAPGAAPAQAPKQPAAPQAAPAQPAPQVARAPIPPPTRHPGMTAAQIVAGAHLQQQQQAAQAQAQAQAHAHAHAPAHAQQPAQAAASSHQPASHSPATTAAHAHEAHPGHSAPAQVAPAHAPAPAAQTHAAPVSQAPAVAPTTQQTAAAAAAPAPAAKTESASAAPAVANAGAAPGATAPAASNGRPPRQQNGKAKEGGGRAPRHEAQATSPSTASKNPVVVLPSSVAHNSGDFQFGSFSMTPLSDNLPAVQAQPAAKPAQSRPQQAAVQAPAPAHQQVHHQQPAHQHHQAHVTETSAQSVRPEAAYHHSHETHAAEQPVEEAGIPQIPPGYMGYPPFMPVPFAYDGDTGRMHPAYYEHPAAFGAPYRAASGSPVGESALNKLGSPQHLLDQSAQQSAAAGNATAQPTAQHGGAYNSQQFLPAGFHYYPPYGGQFYPPAGYTNPRAYKPAAYMGSYPGATQGYGAPEPEEAYGSKYAPHGGYNPAGAAQTTGKPNQSQFASPPAAPIDPYKQDFASKAYNSRDTSAQAYPYQAAYHQAYYPMHMPSYGQPQGQASQPSGRGGNQ